MSKKVRVKQNATYKFQSGKFSAISFASNNVPRPRSGHKIVCNESYILSYGGFNPDNSHNEAPLCYELWKLELAKRVWVKLKVLRFPEPIISNSLVLCGKYLLVYGGTGIPFSHRCSNELFACDLSQDVLNFVNIETTGDSPTPLYGQAVVVKDDLLYTLGGTSGYLFFSDIHCLNMKTSVWKKLYPPRENVNGPEGRYRHEVVLFDNQLIVLGGGTSDAVFGFELLAAFDLSLNVWNYLKTHPDSETGKYPTARRFHSSVHLKDDECVCILGGYDGDQTTEDVWCLNLKSLKWRLVQDIVYPYYFHASCATPWGKIYSFGGVKALPCGELTEEVRSNELVAGYILVPKLAEICWEALAFYWQISDMTYEELISYGIPRSFALRLHKDKR